MPNVDFRYLLPEITIALFGAVVLIVGLWTGKRVERHNLVDNFTPELLSGAGLAIAMMFTIGLLYRRLPPVFGEGVMSHGSYALDPSAIYFKIIAIGVGLCVILMSTVYLKLKQVVRGEYYAFVLFATLAACLVASANALILLWLTLEFLAWWVRDQSRGGELIQMRPVALPPKGAQKKSPRSGRSTASASAGRVSPCHGAMA